MPDTEPSASRPASPGTADGNRQERVSSSISALSLGATEEDGPARRDAALTDALVGSNLNSALKGWTERFEGSTSNLREWRDQLVSRLARFQIDYLLPPISTKGQINDYPVHTPFDNKMLWSLLADVVSPRVLQTIKAKAGTMNGKAAWLVLCDEYTTIDAGTLILANEAYHLPRWTGGDARSFEAYYDELSTRRNELEALGKTVTEADFALRVLGGIERELIPIGSINLSNPDSLKSSDVKQKMLSAINIRAGQGGLVLMAQRQGWKEDKRRGTGIARGPCKICQLRLVEPKAAAGHDAAGCGWLTRQTPTTPFGRWLAANAPFVAKFKESRTYAQLAQAPPPVTPPVEPNKPHAALADYMAASSTRALLSETAIFSGLPITAVKEIQEPEAHLSSGNSFEWILDNGATRHILPTIAAFHELRPLEDSVMGVGGPVGVEGIGSCLVRLHNHTVAKLEDVLYVPTSPRALLSQMAFTSKGCKVEATPWSSLMTCTNQKGELLFTAPNRGGLNVVRFQHLGALDGLLSPSFGAAYLASDGPLAHSRLGHCAVDLSLAVNEVERRLFAAALKGTECLDCSRGKMRSIPHLSSSDTSSPLERVGIDLWQSPFQSKTGAKWMMVVTDHFSRFRWAYFLPSKDRAADAILVWLRHIERQHGQHQLKRLRCDNGREFKNERVERELQRLGVKLEPTAPYSSEQNGVSERSIGILINDVRTLLAESGLCPSFWTYAARHAVYVRNRLPSLATAARGRVPFEVMTGVRPALEHFRPFGCLAIALVPPRERVHGKLSLRGKESVFLGFESGTRNARLWDFGARRVIVSADVRFFERIFPARRPRVSFPSLIDLTGTAEERAAALEQLEAEFSTPADRPSVTSSLPSSPPAPAVDDEEEEDGWGQVLRPFQGETDPIPDFQGEMDTTPDVRGEQTDDSVHSVTPSLPSSPPARLSRLAREVDPANILQDKLRPTEALRAAPRPCDVTPPAAPVVPTPAPLNTNDLYPSGIPVVEIEANLVDEHSRIKTESESTLTSNKMCAPKGTAPSLCHSSHISSVLSATETVSDGLAQAVEAFLSTVEVPGSYRAALASPDADKWLAAVETELKTLEEYGTFELVDEASVPSDRRPLPSHFVFAHKPALVPGEEERFKARLVANGNRQRPGDYSFVSAPVSYRQTFRLLLSKAASEDLELLSIDISGAFLHGDIDTEVYVRLPSEIRSRYPGKALRLRKSLYGLKQAARIWNKTLHDFIVDVLGWQQCDYDPCLYRYQTEAGFLLASFHIDDGAIVGTPLSFLEDQVAKLGGKFPLRNNGAMKAHLGMRVRRDRARRQIFLSQEHYAEELLDRFGLEGEATHPQGLPYNPGVIWQPLRALSSADIEAAKALPYRELVGSLLYLTMTRPDIAYIVAHLARYSSRWTREHFVIGKGVLRYIKGTLSHGLVLGSGPSSFASPVPLTGLVGVCDADWAHDGDGHSISGWALFYNSGLISFGSKKQSIVTDSSCEAELVASAKLGRELEWARHMVDFVSFGSGEGIRTGSLPPVPLLIDNESAKALLSNFLYRARTKHVNMKYFASRDLMDRGKLLPYHIPTDINCADSFTKPLHAPSFLRHRSALNVHPLSRFEGECQDHEGKAGKKDV